MKNGSVSICYKGCATFWHKVRRLFSGVAITRYLALRDHIPSEIMGLADGALVMSKVSKLQDNLSYAPRGMRAERAAAYLDMGRTKFLELVENGRLPQPIEIDGIRVWCRHELDAAFDDFKKPMPAQVNSFDALMGRK